VNIETRQRSPAGSKGKANESGHVSVLLAICVSVAVFLVTAVALMLSAPSAVVGMSVVAIVPAILAAIFSALRPSLRWRWGLLASAPFLAYFVLAAIAYVTVGRPDAHPLLMAVLVGGMACATAALVVRARRS
jgi:glucose-6-phosphate-specific signal transduction histidine kinase